MTTSPALASPSILQNLFWSNLNDINMAQADRDAAKAQVAAVAGVQDAYDAAVVTINTNGDLSAQGRASALLAAGKRGLKQLTALTTPTLSALDAQIVGHSRALRRAAAGPEATMVTELRAAEVRAAFGQFDPLLRPARYLALCAEGHDDAACVAIECASALAPLLAAETTEQGRSIRSARTLPDQASALDVAQDLRALLVASVAAARRHMSVGGTLDPLQVANLGAYPITGDDDTGAGEE
jgi:hypothetical protein